MGMVIVYRSTNGTLNIISELVADCVLKVTFFKCYFWKKVNVLNKANKNLNVYGMAYGG